MTDVNGLLSERAKLYGDSTVFHCAVAAITQELDGLRAGAYQDRVLDPEEGDHLRFEDANMTALRMLAWKMARAAYNPRHRDNYDDAHGYLKIAERCLFPDAFTWEEGTKAPAPKHAAEVTDFGVESWAAEGYDEHTFEITCGNCHTVMEETRRSKPREGVPVLLTICLGCDSIIEVQHPGVRDEG